MGQRGTRAAGGFTLVEILIVVAVIGILAAIAIPNYLRFQARSKQAEARTNLKAIHQAQLSYFAERDGYAERLSELSYSVERGNRYAYLASLTPTEWQDRSIVVASAGGTHDAIEVDCFKFGVTCVARPARGGGLAAFSVTYPAGVVGPTDTGATPGVSGGYIFEARGSVDADVEPDVWLISSGTLGITPNACINAAQGSAGSPVVIFDDVACP
jgi:type IV pilus assembly protein PilA